VVINSGLPTPCVGDHPIDYAKCVPAGLACTHGAARDVSTDYRIVNKRCLADQVSLVINSGFLHPENNAEPLSGGRATTAVF